MERPPQGQGLGPRQCSSINEFPPMEEVQSAVKVDFRYNSTILIPDMRFTTCSGAISKVIMAGMMSDNDTMGNQSMKLQIWRKNVPELGVNEIALPSACEFNMLKRTKMSFICECTLNIAIKSGDVLGIELPPEDIVDFEFYSLTECTVLPRKKVNFARLDIRYTNLHENQPDLTFSYSGTSCILGSINEMFHASLPQIFT